MTALADRARGLPRAIVASDPVWLVARTSLILLVLNTREEPVLFVVAAVLAVVALPNPAIFTSPYPWLVMAALMGTVQAASWEGVDDHVIVTTYWSLALGLALLGREPEKPIAFNARMLAGLVFAFAAFWKLTSPDFVSGRFFHYSLLLDDRFQYLAELVGGMSEADYVDNYRRVAELHVDPTRSPVTLMSTGGLPKMSAAMTAWGVISETGAALSLLAPLPRRLRWLRHFWLFAFAATTYAIVPVGGFGALLLTFGLALTEPGERKRLAYVGGIAAILVWAPLWRVLFY